MATFVTLLWIVIAPVFFARLSVVKAVIWATLIPYLFLPEAFAINLPGLPDIDKTAAVSIGLVLGYLIHVRGRTENSQRYANLPRMKFFGLVLFAFLLIIAISIIASVLNNTEPLLYGPLYIQGLRTWDIISSLGGFILLIIPFIFARWFLANPAAHREMLSAFVIMGIVYTFLMLVEFRMSPQLHNWIYGFHQSSFIQHVRDGYRPKVFLYHGLWVGFFMFMATISAVALWKSTKDSKWLKAALWLFYILMISENLGALVICVMVLGALLLLRPSLQSMLASAVAISVLLYPALRQSQIVPTERILEAATMVSNDRAQSLQFRLVNEDQLLTRALLKPLTGWGSFGRDRVYDPLTGKDISISEGLWIQTIGATGWIGYIGLFGLLTFPIITFGILRRRKNSYPETTMLTLICAGNLIYMIPNSTLTPIGLLVFGALAGFLQYDTGQTNHAVESASSKRYTTHYTRFPHRF